MKRNQVKIFIGLLLVFLVSALSFAIFYFANVQIIDPLSFRILSDSKSELYAISPTNGRIDFFQDTLLNTYDIEQRYIKEVVVLTSEPNEFLALLILGKDSVEITSTSLIHINDNIYSIDRKVFPKVGLWPKLLVLKENSSISLFVFHLKKTKYYFISVFGITFLLSTVFLLLLYLKKNWRSLIHSCKILFKKALAFIKAKWKQIILVFLLSCLPSLIFILFNSDVIIFLNTSAISFVLTFAILIFPLVFFAFFSKNLRINSFFWWSFLISFLVLIFITKSSLFIYGFGFRDDISKFFVKAYGNNFIDCLFTPDSGYLNVFQNLTAYVLLKILGFKQYFPEALQCSVALSFSALFALFNLKRMRVFVCSDKYRFIISLLFALSPFVFSSANFLFEIPFVAAAIILLLLFTYFQKSKSNSSLFILMFIPLFILMALSKPIFVLFIPIVAAVAIFQYYIPKNRAVSISFLVIVLAILVQTVVLYLFAGQVQDNKYAGVGTNYESAFSISQTGLFDVVPSAFFIFLRHFTKLFGVSGFNSPVLNTVMNVISLSFILIIAIYYLYKISRKRDVLIAWFCISAFAISFATVFLYVKSVVPEKLVTNCTGFANMSISEMFSAPALIPYHRYLMLSAFTNFIVILIFVFEIIDKYVKAERIKHFVKISFLVFIAGIPMKSLFIDFNSIAEKVEKVSYWRTYNSLIFSNTDYYIPYNGYSEQKHCIKNGIDKIVDFDVESVDNINICDAYPQSQEWQLIQVLIENNNNTNKFPKIEGLTYGNQIVTATLINGNNQQTKALVYHFDRFYKFEKINIIYSDTTQKYSGLVRFVGLYE